jgi:N-acetylglucosamine-6-phosphate deacetylase
MLIRNCRPVTRDEHGSPTDLLVENGRIARIGSLDESVSAYPVLDAEGRTLIPGLVDLHVHGAGGGDTSDGTKEALQTMSVTLARLGITSFLTTAMIRPELDNRHLQLAGEQTGRDLGGANLLGIHLEGPFISHEKRGGIQPQAVEPPSVERLESLLEITGDKLCMMTIAPEVAGASDVIRAMVQHGIVASFGHSDADYDATCAGLDAGITHATHLYNTMRGVHHRDPGPVPALLERPEVTVQIICDGIHLHPDMVRYIFRQFGPQRCVCITDGMRTMGLPDGRYAYYGKEFESKDGAARFLDGTLIGTAFSLHRMLLNYLDFTDCTLPEAVQACATNPARVLGLADRKGAIKEGLDADLVLLDEDRSIHTTIIAGKIVYQQGTANHAPL